MSAPVSLHHPTRNVGLHKLVGTFLDSKSLSSLSQVNQSSNDAVMNYSDDTWQSLITQASVDEAGKTGNVTLLKKAVELRMPVNHVRALISLCNSRHRADAVMSIFHDGLDPNSTDDDGLTLPLFCVRHGATGLIRDMMQITSVVNFQAVDQHGNQSRTLLQQACHDLRTDYDDNGRRIYPVIDFLLANGANPNTNNAHETPLIIAIWSDNSEVMEILLRAGADVEGLGLARQAPKGRTPLAYAFTRRNYDTMKVLLDHGADPNRQDSHAMGRTVFDAALAVYEGNMIKLFRAAGHHNDHDNYTDDI